MPDVVDVLIVGAGLSGMSAYLEAKQRPGLTVALAEHEAEPGGELRWYPGFPEAAELCSAFVSAAAGDPHVCLRTTATGVLPPLRPGDALTVNLSSATGSQMVRARAVLVCAGTFDRPREGERIPGSRPAGVMTPGFAMRVLAEGAVPARRVVVYAGCRRDMAAALRLQQAGVRVAALAARPETLSSLAWEASRLDAPWVAVRGIAAVHGRARVEAVTVETDQGLREIPCDGLVYAGGRDAAWFALKGLAGVLASSPAFAEGRESAQVHAGVAVAADPQGRTPVPGVFAAGTCVSLDPDHAGSAADGARVMRYIADEWLRAAAPRAE
ncbi:MAG: FAD-dependent oxidoreductase [Alicyclobacillus sp.]|nr:FAD-dependent oxidoreductase [Alicyclobacillus sp.]